MSTILKYVPEADYDELRELELALQGRSEEEIRKFAMTYRGRRKDAQTTLILCVVGFFGFAGLHRLVNNDIGMGILYLLTAGFCGIGTLIDTINHRKLNAEANAKVIRELSQYAYYQ
jgi:TM2 domain-containing membrane protein YozV